MTRAQAERVAPMSVRSRARLTAFEVGYLCAEPFLPYLYREVRRRLRAIADDLPATLPETLDVGGRRSHYTIGLPGIVTVSDLPRVTQLQRQLNLGVTDDMTAQLLRRRSNIREVVIDDMTRSGFHDGRFHCVVAVEVLEHVEDDESFVRNVQRVLKPGGTFLMTTPNGDHLGPPTNPDHKRHYTRQHLHSVLKTCFSHVVVEYAVRGGPSYARGLRSWSTSHPVQTVAGMIGNVVSGVESSRRSVKHEASGTQHLIATCRKA
jgi:SAM-dependent methyltransferase